MPEIPEVQALAERLHTSLRGTTIIRADALQFSGLKTFDPAPDAVYGRPVTGVGRRGKFVIIDLDGPRILFHLSQGGRVDVELPSKRTKPKGAVVRFHFDDGTSVLLKEYGTERKAGWWVVAAGDDGPLTKLGPEPDSPEFARFVMGSDDSRRVHTILRDQRTVAGIGRGYSDDILHRARLSPTASLKMLDPPAREALLAVIREVLDEALDVERRREGGLPTKIGDHFAVHGRYGLQCPRCGTILRRVSYESHEITYCPDCQTGGKVLADRRFSRLVR